MAAPYTASTIAKSFIAWAEGEEMEFSNLKLQKLLYFAQGHHFAFLGGPLFDDRMEAWSHGPVVPTVYRTYKDFGNRDLELSEDDLFSWDQINDETTQFLMDVWERYGIYSAGYLRNLAHDEGPWRDCWRPDEDHIEITKGALEKYFKTAHAPS